MFAALARSWGLMIATVCVCLCFRFFHGGDPVEGRWRFVAAALASLGVAAWTLTRHFERLGASRSDREAWQIVDARDAERAAGAVKRKNVRAAWKGLLKSRR